MYETKKLIGNETDEEVASMIIQYQLQKEKDAEKTAENNLDPYVIVCDRSGIEPAAYIGIDKVEKILSQLGKNFVKTRDSYDLVIHLTTVAKSAKELYTKENNKNRKESSSESIALDDRILNIWSKHPNRIIIDNYENDFNKKIKKVEEVIIKYLEKI